jgi:hypothetical protein
MPLFEKTGTNVFRNVHTWEGLVSNLRDLHLEQHERMHVAIIASKQDFAELLRSSQRPAGLEHVASADSLAVFHYERHFGREKQHGVSGDFVVAHPFAGSVHLVVFVSKPSFWRKGILPLLESLYPRAVRPFLTQHELHQILKTLQRAVQPNGLRVLEFSSKKRLAVTARKRFQTVREWTDLELDAVFREAKDKNVWFRSVSFDLVAHENGRAISTGVRGTLSKYGYFACNNRFDLFEKTLLKELAQYATERLKFFSGRDRAMTPNHSPRPLQVRYDTDVFRSAEQTKKLVEAMQRFKHGTCTVLHANPYIHLSVVDNIDFSSADIWVLSKNEILIVPQLRASEAGLKRVVNHIFEQFREGELCECEKR